MNIVNTIAKFVKGSEPKETYADRRFRRINDGIDRLIACRAEQGRRIWFLEDRLVIAVELLQLLTEKFGLLYSSDLVDKARKFRFDPELTKQRKWAENNIHKSRTGWTMRRQPGDLPKDEQTDMATKIEKVESRSTIPTEIVEIENQQRGENV